MTKCRVLDDRGFLCVDQAGHPGEHWFQKDASVCDSQDERGYVCTLRPGHEGSHGFRQDVTPRGSVSRVFRADDDPEHTRQRELDALNPPPDPTVPDNSDLDDFADVLPPRDQVALWAGRIVRKEARIESMLQTIHYELSGGGLSYAIVPQRFGGLLDDVCKMLKALQIDDATYVEDCLAALGRLRVAHTARNRIVHDQWVLRQEAPGQFAAVKAPKGVVGPAVVPQVKWDLAEFRDCYERLRVCSAEISGIYWSIGSFVGDRPDIWRDMLPSNRETIAGRFRLTGEDHWEFTEQTFVAQLSEQMQREAERLRARLAQHLPDFTQDDDL